MRHWFVILMIATGTARAGEPKRVLYYDQDSSHPSSKFAGTLLTKMGAEQGAFVLEACDDARKWSDDYFAPYAAIIMFAAGNPELTDANKSALLNFVRRGNGFVGIHSTSQFCRKERWRDFEQMLGAVHAGGLGLGMARVTTEDRAHPATRHLEPWFALSDDYYRFTNWSRARTHVLLSVDVRSLPQGKRHIKGVEADHPVSWCHRYDKGRVFYTTLGHGETLWKDKRFQQHVFHAVRWAAGAAPARVLLGTDYRIREVRRPAADPIRLVLNR